MIVWCQHMKMTNTYKFEFHRFLHPRLNGVFLCFQVFHIVKSVYTEPKATIKKRAGVSSFNWVCVFKPIQSFGGTRQCIFLARRCIDEPRIFGAILHLYIYYTQYIWCVESRNTVKQIRLRTSSHLIAWHRTTGTHGPFWSAQCMRVRGCSVLYACAVDCRRYSG